jgi:hypothetical protein
MTDWHFKRMEQNEKPRPWSISDLRIVNFRPAKVPGLASGLERNTNSEFNNRTEANLARVEPAVASRDLHALGDAVLCIDLVRIASVDNCRDIEPVAHVIHHHRAMPSRVS